MIEKHPRNVSNPSFLGVISDKRCEFDQPGS